MKNPALFEVEVEVEVTLRLTVSQSVSQYALVSGTLVSWDKILFLVGMLLSKICGFVSKSK
jgi:hypothetical protein